VTTEADRVASSLWGPVLLGFSSVVLLILVLVVVAVSAVERGGRDL